MKYRLVQRVNPQDTEGARRWHAMPVNEGTITLRGLAPEVEKVSSLSRGDVSNVIETLIDIIPRYLMMGRSVNLDELGTMRISFGSEGVDTPDEFHVSMIRNVRIIFTPSTLMLAQLSRMGFEHARTFTINIEEGGEEGGEDNGGTEPEEPGDI